MYFTYTNDEVRRLLDELDKEQVLLLDYTSDSQTENSVLNWDVIGRFPWIFGIFQAYEPNSEIRNDYAFIERVMEKAKADPLCVGFVLWPELSHADTFMLEYAAANAWADGVIDARRFAADFCRRRYGAQSDAMLPVRLAMLDISAAAVWSADDGRKLTTDLFFNIFDHFAFKENESAERYDGLIELLEKALFRAPEIEHRAGGNRFGRSARPPRCVGHPPHAARPPYLADDPQAPPCVSDGRGCRAALRILSRTNRSAGCAVGGDMRTIRCVRRWKS